MKIGPLGCLGMLVAGVAGWAAGRAPALYAVAAAASAPPRAVTPRPIAPAPAAPPAAAPIFITMPAGPAPAPQVIVVRDERRGEARDPGPAELRWTLPDDRSRVASTPPTAPGTPVAVPEATSSAAPPGNGAGFVLATLAYSDLAHGDRQGAAARFAAALALDPGAPEAKAWRRQLGKLRRRWSVEGYTLFREDGAAALGVNPVLGGGQTSAQIAYSRRPLARRPVYAVARLTVANSGGFTPRSGAASTAQAALGVRWQAVPQISISGERSFRVNHTGRAAWTVRAAGGHAEQFGPVLADAYAEAGIVGFSSFDPFASLQARAAIPFGIATLHVEPGIGVWSAWQRTALTVDRLDMGPTVTVASDRWNLRASADYRLKVAGNARPGSGPAVTISSAF